MKKIMPSCQLQKCTFFLSKQISTGGHSSGQKTPTFGTFLSEIFSHRMRALAETVSSCCRIKQHSLEFPLWLSLDHTVLIEKKILLASQATNRSYSPLENYNSITYQTQYSSWSMMHCSHLSGICILTLGSISIPQFSTNACHCYPTTIPLNG